MERRSVREGIGDSLREYDVSPKSTRSRTSRAYARFFEDHEEVSVVKPNGKRTIDRTYAGDYYSQALPLWQRVLVRIGFTLCLVLSVILFLENGTALMPCNQVWYVTASQFAAVACLGWMTWSMGEYLFSVGKLTVGEYKSVVSKMRKAPWFAAGTIWLTMVMTIICFLLVPEERPVMWPLFLLRYFAAGILLTLIRLVDRRISYRVTESEGKRRVRAQEEEHEN